MFQRYGIKRIVLAILVVMVISIVLAGLMWAAAGGIKNIARFITGNINMNDIIDMVTENINEEKAAGISGVKNINISTISEDINIIPANTDEIKAHFHGSVATSNREYIPALVLNKSGNTINIKIEHKPAVGKVNYYDSNTKLDVYMPLSYGESLAISTTSANTSFDSLELTKFSWKTVSGSLTAKSLITSGDTILNSTSGSVIINGFSDNFSFETVSGKLSADSYYAKASKLNTTSGNIKIGQFAGDLDFSSVSGTIDVQYKDFNNNINIETTSGDSKIKLPEGFEFHLSFTSTSGEVSSDFPISVKGTVKKNSLEGTVVSSKNSIKVKTVSGDLETPKVRKVSHSGGTYFYSVYIIEHKSMQ